MSWAVATIAQPLFSKEMYNVIRIHSNCLMNNFELNFY